MTANANEESALKIARAKSKATAKTVRLLLFVRGGWALGVATAMTVLLTVLLHLNAPLVFAGSFIGALILGLAKAPVAKIWQSSYAVACQEEGLWDKAKELATGGIEDAIKDILAGRTPSYDGIDLNLKLSNLQVMYIRKGDLRTAVKFAEFLLKNTPKEKGNHPYHMNGVGTLLVELGDYDRGFQMLTSNLDDLEQTNRTESPAYVTALLGLTQASIDLERISDAERYLKRLEEAVEANAKKEPITRADKWVQQEVAKKSIESTFVKFVTTRLKELKADPEADIEITVALEMVNNPEVMNKLILFYPELLSFHAGMMCRRKNYDKAEKLALQAIKYYETKTVYKGGDYLRAKLYLAYARAKTGKNTAEEMESILQQYRELYTEPHHGVALVLQKVGEAWANSGVTDKARARLEESLRMKQRLFAEGSPGIRETESLLASLPAATIEEEIKERKATA